MQWSLIKLFTSYHLTEYLLPLTSFILTVWKMICTVNTSYGGVTRYMLIASENIARFSSINLCSWESRILCKTHFPLHY